MSEPTRAVGCVLLGMALGVVVLAVSAALAVQFFDCAEVDV